MAWLCFVCYVVVGAIVSTAIMLSLDSTDADDEIELGIDFVFFMVIWPAVLFLIASYFIVRYIGRELKKRK